MKKACLAWMSGTALLLAAGMAWAPSSAAVRIVVPMTGVERDGADRQVRVVLGRERRGGQPHRRVGIISTDIVAKAASGYTRAAWRSFMIN
jgi:hypothetical protein